MNDEWRNDAACKGKPTEWWYPPQANIPGPDRNAARAKAICAECPVALDCAAYADNNRERWGIWGGYSIAHRRNAYGVAVRTMKCRTCMNPFEALGTKRTVYCSGECRHEGLMKARRREYANRVPVITSDPDNACLQCGERVLNRAEYVDYCGHECHRIAYRERYARMVQADPLPEVAS